jgi:hypothetical protein
MRCCGKKRQSLKRQTPPPAIKKTERLAVVDPPPQTTPIQPLFRNTATANLSIRGPISGQTYFFPATGRAMPVDERDAPFLSTISHLQLLDARIQAVQQLQQFFPAPTGPRS